MKISKLFHWLYALVMLLPIFAIGVTCGYAMFNKNAYQSYADNFIKSQNPITSINSYINNETYYVNNLNVDASTVFDIGILYKSINIDVYETFGFNTTLNVVGFQMIQYDTSGGWYTIPYYLDNNNELQKGVQVWTGLGKTLKEFTFVADTSLSQASTYWRLSGSTQVTQYIFQTNKVSEVFYYSVDKVTESPLFSWAYDSFLTAPFVYIVSLFSMPTNHVVVELLSYWLAISIIWLVFDLVMYVPLLVHRWLDKGVLE